MHLYACLQWCLSGFESIKKQMRPTVLGGLQVLVGQLNHFPALPDAMPALHLLCNEPKVLSVSSLVGPMLFTSLCVPLYAERQFR